MKKEWIINGIVDFYDLDINKIIREDDEIDNLTIPYGTTLKLNIYDKLKNPYGFINKEYVMVDYIEFSDRNNQIVCSLKENVRDRKLRELGL